MRLILNPLSGRMINGGTGPLSYLSTLEKYNNSSDQQAMIKEIMQINITDRYHALVQLAQNKQEVQRVLENEDEELFKAFIFVDYAKYDGNLDMLYIACVLNLPIYTDQFMLKADRDLLESTPIKEIAMFSALSRVSFLDAATPYIIKTHHARTPIVSAGYYLHILPVGFYEKQKTAIYKRVKDMLKAFQIDMERESISDVLSKIVTDMHSCMDLYDMLKQSKSHEDYIKSYAKKFYKLRLLYEHPSYTKDQFRDHTDMIEKLQIKEKKQLAIILFRMYAFRYQEIVHRHLGL